MTPMTPELPQRSGIYCRLSYAPDGSVEKVERQENDCRDLAQRLGWTVSEDHIFPDNSRSAWQRNRKRPQWDLMLQAIEAGEIDGIIVYHGDRLIRQPFDLETLISISETKRLRIASPSGTRDLDNPDDRFILRIEAAQACRESDNTSRRVRRAIRVRLEKGLTQSGGHRPFGFGPIVGTRLKINSRTGEHTEAPVYDVTKHVPEEAAIIEDVVSSLLAGLSRSAALRLINSQSTTTEGNPWTEKALRNVLLAPRIAGLIERDGQLYEAAWDGIVSRDAWEQVSAIYRQSAQEHPYPGRERVYLLSGVGGAECGLCGSYMRTKPSGGRNRKTSRLYYCPVCRKVGRNQALLDAYVEGRAVSLLQDPRLAEEISASSASDGTLRQIADLERRRRETREQIENLADHPGLDAGLALAAVASYDRRIAELRSQMRAATADRQLTRLLGISAEQWRSEPLDVRSATVRNLLRVVVLPTTRRGPGLDTSAIRVTRRKRQSP
ncbi:recombinase family protein [Streptomyces sp. NPDC058992]|uniref:recombinase family protein n=1 Tax=Streptomyces sp. NPDC058992 TaxID=3346688 RepID=UPI00368CB9C6